MVTGLPAPIRLGSESCKRWIVSHPSSSHLPLILPHRLRDRIDHFTCEGASLAEFFAGKFAGSAVDVDGGAGGVEEFHLLPEERTDDPAKHIARAGFGECAVAGAVHVDFYAVGDNGAMALEHDDLLEGVGGQHGDFGTLTQTAVKNVQAILTDCDNVPLAVDGIVGPKTWEALYS